MPTRVVLLLILVAAVSPAADKRRVWQTGNVASVEVIAIEPHNWNAWDNTPQLVGPSQPGQPLPQANERPSDPQPSQRPPYATIRFTILSDRETFFAKRVTAVFAKPKSNSFGQIDPASIAPWVKELPGTIRFSVRGRALYYLDKNGKERKATLTGP